MTGEEASPTVLLQLLKTGDEQAANALFGLLYAELHAIAGRIFQSQRREHTLQATALVHEAYLKLIRPGKDAAIEDRAHFFNLAARAMRQILINHARDRDALKRGGPDGQRVTLMDETDPERAAVLDFLAVHEALEALAELDEGQARIAELRFFSGLTVAEIATVVQRSTRAVEADWKMAKAWLAHRLEG